MGSTELLSLSLCLHAVWKVRSREMGVDEEGGPVRSPGVGAEPVPVRHPSSTGPGARRPGRPV